MDSVLGITAEHAWAEEQAIICGEMAQAAKSEIDSIQIDPVTYDKEQVR